MTSSRKTPDWIIISSRSVKQLFTGVLEVFSQKSIHGGALFALFQRSSFTVPHLTSVRSDVTLKYIFQLIFGGNMIYDDIANAAYSVINKLQERGCENTSVEGLLADKSDLIGFMQEVMDIVKADQERVINALENK